MLREKCQQRHPDFNVHEITSRQFDSPQETDRGTCSGSALDMSKNCFEPFQQVMTSRPANQLVPKTLIDGRIFDRRCATTPALLQWNGMVNHYFCLDLPGLLDQLSARTPSLSWKLDRQGTFSAQPVADPLANDVCSEFTEVWQFLPTEVFYSPAISRDFNEFCSIRSQETITSRRYKRA